MQEVLRAKPEGLPGVLGLLLAPWTRLKLSFFSSSSLLELQGPDVLWPARPAFGFLVVAAHCAFQDFILGRKEVGEKNEKRNSERITDPLPP